MKLTLGTEHEAVREVQERLRDAGFDPGEVNGVFDERTRKAVADYQMESELDASGVIDEATLGELDVEVTDEEDLPSVEFEREQFPYLIAQNPNYFGNVPWADFEAVEELETETVYEELTCVGYEPAAERLEAVVHVKRSYGYGGDICTSGTPEYVRFYGDWGEDGDWKDLGMVNFTAYDIPGEKPLEYGVSLEIDPEERFCTVENLPEVRAILSWNQPPPPDTPNFSPVWGNVLDSHIQIDPLSLISVVDIADQFEFELPDPILEGIDTSQPLSFEAPSLGVAELAATYEDTSVPPKRYGFTHLAESISKPTLAADLDDQSVFEPFLGLDLDIDVDDLVAGIIEQSGDTYYEELDCVGLTRDGLNATLSLKRPNGYSGGLCTAGSDEYVAFWEWDPDASQWDHLGTTSVNVHDIDAVPGEGLEYAAFLPATLAHRRQPCAEGASTVRIRATLSWEQPPPPGDPYWTPTWGNSVETLVHVPPGPALEGRVGYMESVGNVGVCDVDKSTGLANGTGILAGFTAKDSPFGGQVTVTGFVTDPPAVLDGATPLEYRVLVRPYDPPNSPDWRPVRDEFEIVVTEKQGAGPPTQHRMTQTPDADGFYTYREDNPPGNWRYVAGRVLARWGTAGKEGRWELKLQVKEPGEAPVDAKAVACPDGTSRGTVVLRLDNTRPDADLEITDVKPPGGSKQSADECGDFEVGSTIYGTYSASDDHFGRLSFGVAPGKHTNGAAVDPGPGSHAYPAVPTTGESGTWELDTTGMDPCGFVIHLDVDDRTIVNSGRVGWDGGANVSFCLEETTQTDGGTAPTTPLDADLPESEGDPDETGDASEQAVAITDHQFDSPGDDHENLNEEYVTFENAGDAAVDLTGWHVEDDAGHSYSFPDGFTLDAGASVTLRTGSGDDTETDCYWGSERAVWDNTGDSVFLYDADGDLVTKESY